MTFNKTYYILALLISSNAVIAQQSINAAGGDISGSGGSVAFSIGQVAYKSYTDGSITESEGVQKAYEYFSDIFLPATPGEMIISNYMSPNNDGQNDTWKINNLSVIKDDAITIVDAWGNRVFSVENNYNNEFDGTSGGKKLADGVYYYIISENGKTKYSGSITILK